jgi:glucokinase
VDIGGTKIAAGVVDESGQVLSRARRDTPSHGDEAGIIGAADLAGHR